MVGIDYLSNVFAEIMVCSYDDDTVLLVQVYIDRELIMIDLAVPSDRIIEFFDNLWNCRKYEIPEDGLLSKCEIEPYKVSYNGIQIVDFREFKFGEDVINSAFSDAGLTTKTDSYKGIKVEKLYQAVLLLDTIYHTRLSNPYRFALKLHKFLEKLNMRFDDPNATVDLVNSITELDKSDDKKDSASKYAYSFATKFCNRINPEVFPIYDSYVAGMLIWYRDKKKFNNFKNNSLGNYKTYIDVYNSLLVQNNVNINVDKVNYRRIDHFLWTYAKIIEAIKIQSLPSPISISFKYEK